MLYIYWNSKSLMLNIQGIASMKRARKATMLNTSEYESMTWFLHMIKDWIGFDCLEDFVNSVLQPLLLLLVLFLLIYYVPSGIVLIFYAFTFYLYIWKKKYNIKGDAYNELWNKPRKSITYLLNLYGKIWHGIKPCLDIVGCIEGKKAFCVDILKRGYLLGIAPGGLREQNFSDENYSLEWSTRTGFAEVALKSKVPIIPMFTQNLREAYRTVGNTRLSKWLYEHFRYLVLPIYGGFPVKLRTYIGEPIPYDPNLTAKELAEKTKIAIENLRDRHQKLPGNILRGLLERFDKNKKDA
ncbi:transmembrane protein 68-like isoform X6 [Crotalus tigris]|uniref:transmembrane protein 68-like isoform X6 n=1 Tax=Crotalus tigris TaxID=88082 RepID=UPI00192F9DD8|nr:transmembrane protein 68-like isoform X6 [Crotalus tigris]